MSSPTRFNLVDFVRIKEFCWPTHRCFGDLFLFCGARIFGFAYQKYSLNKYMQVKFQKKIVKECHPTRIECRFQINGL